MSPRFHGAMSIGRRAIRGAILAVWIVALTYGALLAIRDKASDYILSGLPSTTAPDKDAEQARKDYAEKATPMGLLAMYTNENSEFGTVLPIRAVLDLFTPGWEMLPNVKMEEFWELFQRVDSALHAYARDPQFNASTGKISSDFLIRRFKPITDIPPVTPTTEIRAWIEQFREARERQQSKALLVNTFVLLTILGAFGSMIFLTRDFMYHRGDATPLVHFIFRPVLGIFLGIGCFVVVISTNALVSTSSILDVRRETLWILAFAAGLMAEKVYAVLDRRVAEALGKWSRDGAGDRAKKTHASPPPTGLDVGDATPRSGASG